MKKKKNEELFEDLGFEEQDQLADDDDEDSSFELYDVDEEEDPAELERRRTEYAKLRKNDKIFNNSYNMGQNLSEDDEDSRSSSEIKLDASSPDYHLYDRDQYSDHMDDKITQYDIDQFVIESREIQAILGDQPDKRKFNKTEINDLFVLILNGVSRGQKSSVFVSPIHVLDAISSLTTMEYKKLFDMLTYEHKEMLLLELDKKYCFLDKPSKNLKIF